MRVKDKEPLDELIKKHNERADLLMRSILLAWAPLAAEAWQEHLAWEASL
jgi:hypothetical protein